jgi:hypothetical protein
LRLFERQLLPVFPAAAVVLPLANPNGLARAKAGTSRNI